MVPLRNKHIQTVATAYPTDERLETSLRVQTTMTPRSFLPLKHWPFASLRINLLRQGRVRRAIITCALPYIPCGPHYLFGGTCLSGVMRVLFCACALLTCSDFQMRWRRIFFVFHESRESLRFRVFKVKCSFWSRFKFRSRLLQIQI